MSTEVLSKADDRKIGVLKLKDSTVLWSVVLFVAAIIVRLIYLGTIGIPSQAGGDAEEYIALARNVANGFGLSPDGVTSTTFRPPLFSWLLGMWCYWLGSTSLQTMVAFQVLVQSLCAPLTYLLVRDVVSHERLALAGGLFVALYPFIFSNVGLVMQESIQMLLATAIGVAVVKWYRHRTVWRAVFVGLLFGLGALSKAPFLIGLVIAPFGGLLAPHYDRRMLFRQCGIICTVIILVVLPWTLRNYFVSGQWILINSQGPAGQIWAVADGNFIIRHSLAQPLREVPTFQSGILLTYGNADGRAYLTKVNNDLLNEGLGEPLVTEGVAAAARSYLLTHPAYVFKKTVRGFILLFSPDTSGKLTGFLKTRLAAIALFHFPLAAGLLVGTFRSLRDRNVGISILCVFAAVYLLIHAPVAVGGGRYCLPLLPLLIAITGYSFTAYDARTTYIKSRNRSLISTGRA